MNYLVNKNCLVVILISIIALGCAEQPKIPAAKTILTSEKPSKSYPVSDMYGRHTLPEFVNTDCNGLYDMNCERAYIDYFGQKLIAYYSKTHFALRICDWNPYVCSRDWNMEDYVRNYGVL